MPGQKGTDNTLIYLLAHKSKEAAATLQSVSDRPGLDRGEGRFREESRRLADRNWNGWREVGVHESNGLLADKM
jgi:hypothetical protein